MADQLDPPGYTFSGTAKHCGMFWTTNHNKATVSCSVARYHSTTAGAAPRYHFSMVPVPSVLRYYSHSGFGASSRAPAESDSYSSGLEQL